MREGREKGADSSRFVAMVFKLRCYFKEDTQSGQWLFGVCVRETGGNI